MNPWRSIKQQHADAGEPMPTIRELVIMSFVSLILPGALALFAIVMFGGGR